MKSVQIAKNGKKYKKNWNLEDIRNMRGGLLSCDGCLLRAIMKGNGEKWEREKRRYKNKFKLFW